MDDLIRKYSEELQKTQRERNQLKHQLAEKDKEIEELKKEIKYVRLKKVKEGSIAIKLERHQVCEEIREFVKSKFTYIDNLYSVKLCDYMGWVATGCNIGKILDQIEQGEKK